jgi:hypothetical protein
VLVVVVVLLAVVEREAMIHTRALHRTRRYWTDAPSSARRREL